MPFPQIFNVVLLGSSRQILAQAWHIEVKVVFEEILPPANEVVAR